MLTDNEHVRDTGGGAIAAITGHGLPSEDEVERILAETGSKEYNDLRDRAAYVYVTGTFPTHLRPLSVSLLRMITRLSRKPVSLDGRSGSQKLNEKTAQALSLASHPMVMKVLELVQDDWKIFYQREATERRPYSKIPMYRIEGATTLRITVQVDGSILDGW